MNNVYYLKQDVISHCSKQIYCRKGDEVPLISQILEHINTVAVEKDGKRFPVPVDLLSVERIVSDAPILEPIKTRAVVKKKNRRKVA